MCMKVTPSEQIPFTFYFAESGSMREHAQICTATGRNKAVSCVHPASTLTRLNDECTFTEATEKEITV